MNRRAPPLEKARRTSDDEFDDHRRQECAKAGARWLKASFNIKRPIEALTMKEFTGLAEAMIAQYIVTTSQRPPEEVVTDKMRDMIAGIA